MDITIRTEQLRIAINRAKTIAADKKSTMPILTHVLLDAEITPEGGRLTVRANDLEMSLCSQHPCEVKKAGTLAVPAKALSEIVKALPDAATRLKAGANNRMELTNGASSFRLAGMAAEDFPAMPSPGEAEWNQVGSSLKDGLDRVAFAMSSDETRYNLNGVYVEGTEAGVNLVATDGHRMALYCLDQSNRLGLEVGKGVIVPRKAVGELRSLLGEAGESASEIALTENTLAYRRAGLTYTARLVDGSFPAYGQVIPALSKTPILVNRAELQKAVQRVLLVSWDKSVSVQAAEGKLTLTCKSPDMGDATDSVAAENISKEIKLGLNGAYILDMLGAAESESMMMHILGETDPVVLVPAKDSSHQYVLMPMRS